MRLITKLITVTFVVAFAGSASAQTICAGPFDGGVTLDLRPVGPVAGCDRIWGDEADEAFIVLDGLNFTGAAELTILPGTVVRGNPRNTVFAPATPTVGTPGTLVVTAGGFLNAQATPGAPIIHTTAAVDNQDAACTGGAPDGIPDDCASTGGQVPGDGEPDDWAPGDALLDADPLADPLSPLLTNGEQTHNLHGGLVLIGTAPTNLDDSGFGTGVGTCEGLPVPGVSPTLANYGGSIDTGDPFDSSGVVRYYGVRHAGDEIAPADELNGITFCGVGAGTMVDHIEAYANGDDGIEMFGGNVNVFNYVGTNIGDDIVDVDQGYAGLFQDIFTLAMFYNENDGDTVGTGGSGDAAGEWDGEDCPGNCVAPLVPHPRMVASNWTHVGNIEGAINEPSGGIVFPGATGSSANSDNQGVDADSQWSGLIANSLIIGMKGGTFDNIEYAGTGGGALGLTPFLCASSGDHTLDAAAVTGSSDCEAAIAASIASGLPSTLFNPDQLNTFLFVEPTAATPLSDNYFVNSASSTIPASYQFLIDENFYFDPDGGGTGKLIGSKVNDAGTTAGGPHPPMNPRPDSPSDAQMGNGIVPNGAGTGRGMDPSETYRGAFAPSSAALWIQGWTAVEVGGIAR